MTSIKTIYIEHFVKENAAIALQILFTVFFCRTTKTFAIHLSYVGVKCLTRHCSVLCDTLKHSLHF